MTGLEATAVGERRGQVGGSSGRWPVWVVAGGTAAGTAAVMLALVMPTIGPESLASRAGVVAYVIGMVVLCGTGAVLLQRDRSDPMGRSLVLAGGTGVLARLVTGGVVWAATSGATVPDVVAWTTNWIWVPAHWTAVLTLVRFPTGRPDTSWGRAVAVAATAWGVSTCLVTAVLPGPLGIEVLGGTENPFGLAGPVGTRLHDLLNPLFLAVPLLTGLAASTLVVRFVRADELVRQQLRWVLAAVLALAAASVLALLADVGGLLEAVAYLLLPAAIARAVLRHGLWDLGRVLRRSLVHAGATAVLTVCYLVVAHLVGSRAAPLVAALGVAALAAPVGDAARRLLERALFGDRGDPDRVIASLAAHLDAGGTSLTASTAEQLARSLRFPWVAVDDASGAEVACAGVRSGGEAARLPLRAGDHLVGWLVVGERAPGEALSPVDAQRLRGVAAHAGLALRAETLTAELERSLDSLRRVREDERGRIQRELHDELGPGLAAITLRAEAARNLAAQRGPSERGDPGGSQLDVVLRDLGEQAEAMVGVTRRIISDMRPLPLETSTLQEALRAAAADLATGPGRPAVTVSLDPGLDRVGETAQVAVYRIAVEALRNAVRHAGAAAVQLTVTVGDGTATVVVDDDGPGAAPAAAEGVGIRSMRERARLSGGALTVGPRPGGGTRVRATVKGDGP